MKTIAEWIIIPFYTFISHRSHYITLTNSRVSPLSLLYNSIANFYGVRSPCSFTREVLSFILESVPQLVVEEALSISCLFLLMTLNSPMMKSCCFFDFVLFSVLPPLMIFSSFPLIDCVPFRTSAISRLLSQQFYDRFLFDTWLAA
jgi:hypothetical protein